MPHEIPTHLAVEDRAFYGLSARQVTLLTVGCAGAYTAWNQWLGLPLVIRLALVVTCVAVTLILALVQPHGRSLDGWAFIALRYLSVPKRAVWRVTATEMGGERTQAELWAEWTPQPAWREERA